MSTNHYFGGKSADVHYHQIINLIPPHHAFIEPFGGKVGIFRHKRPSYRTFIIERDERLENYYQKLGIMRCHDITAFKNRLFKTGPGAYYIIEDAFEFLNEPYLIDRDEHYVYCDPPYPLDSRKDNRPTYRFEMSEDDHINLLYILKGYGAAKIGLSTYYNETYQYALAEVPGWDCTEIQAQTRHGRVTEQFWMNYPSPTELHDYRYLGADFREREDIVRKQKRWVKNFADLPILEQKAMIERLTAAIAKSAESGQGKKRKKAKSLLLQEIISDNAPS